MKEKLLHVGKTKEGLGKLRFGFCRSRMRLLFVSFIKPKTSRYKPFVLVFSSFLLLISCEKEDKVDITFNNIDKYCMIYNEGPAYTASEKFNKDKVFKQVLYISKQGQTLRTIAMVPK